MPMQAPSHITPELLRYILDNWAGPWYACPHETARRKVIANALSTLAERAKHELKIPC